MASEFTRADSLREYLTGAASAGGVQTSPNLSLGNHRSASQVHSYGFTIGLPAIGYINLDFVSGQNTAGKGTLECTDANHVKWKDSDGDFGDLVAIANGETKLLEVDEEPGAFVRVRRLSAEDLPVGTSEIVLAQQINNPLGFDDVASAEAVAGDNEYRATIIRNVSTNQVLLFRRWIGTLGTSRVSAAAQLPGAGAGTIGISTGTFDDWPKTGWCRVEQSGGTLREIVYYSSRTSTVLTVPSTGRARLGTSAGAGTNTDLLHAVPGVRIGIDSAGVVSGTTAIQTVANEGTAPTGITWSTGITSATGLNIGTVAAGSQVGIWIHREIPAGAVYTTLGSNLFHDSFSAVT